MTTRPGNAALGIWQNHRTKRACNLVEITRTDGVVMRWSDHDRRLTFQGQVFEPAVFVGMSAERREVSAATPSREMHGIIDGADMLIPDLLGNRYRGAVVRHYVTDWQYPWLVIAKYWKTVRAVIWDGLRFRAQLDGITQRLERPAGGRFGGIMSYECPYVFGDAATCKKDISGDTHFGVKVETVVDDRLQFTLYSASFPGTYADNFYRYGEIDWRWGPADYAGTASTVTQHYLAVAGSPWEVDEHVGKYVLIVNTTNGYVVDRALITNNTFNRLIYEALPGGVPAYSTFEIAPVSDNSLHVSPIIAHVDSSRTLTLFVDTPYPIQVGDRGHLRPGCDGLFTTCRDVHSNADNFGGNHLQPRPGELLEATP